MSEDETNQSPAPGGDVPLTNQTVNTSEVSPEPTSSGIVSPSPVTSPVTSAVVPSPKKGGQKKKLLLVLVIVLVMLLGGSAGAYFGIIAPNKPETIWKKALKNTADGYDKLVEYSRQQKDMKGVKVKGGLKLEGTAAGDGTISAQTYEGNGTYHMDIGIAGSRYELEGLTLVPDGAKNPDLYFKVKGIKGLGGLMQVTPLAESGSLIDSLDNQWIFVDHTLFDQLEGSMASQQSQPQLSRDDINAIAKAIGEVNREYLLTDAPDKAVLNVAQQVGKEDKDGRSTYHYKVGVHKENLKKYITALKDKLKQTKLKDAFNESTYNQFFDNLLTSIDKTTFDTNDTADVWVDVKTKLIRLVRFTDEREAENHVEIGLLYDGGDDYPFVVNLAMPKDPSGPSSGSLKTTLNTRTNVVTINVAADFTGKEKEKITGELKIEPSNDKVNVSKPEGAKPVMEIIGKLFGGLLGGSGSLSPGGGLEGLDATLNDLDI